jgi:hypothetical protein
MPYFEDRVLHDSSLDALEVHLRERVVQRGGIVRLLDWSIKLLHLSAEGVNRENRRAANGGVGLQPRLAEVFLDPSIRVSSV